MLLDNKFALEIPLSLEMITGQGQSLPGLPVMYGKVCASLDTEGFSVEEITAMIEDNPVIAIRLLKLVNSLDFHFPCRIGSVSQAVSILGREALKQLLLASTISSIFGPLDNPAFSDQLFWLHGIKTGLIARELACTRLDVEAPEMLFSAGLLHDIGRLLMVSRAPDLMMSAEEYMARKHVNVVDAERVRVGVTHIETGEILLRQWQLPSSLIDCVRYHHSAEHTIASTYLVYVANHLSSQVLPTSESEVCDAISGISLSDRFDIPSSHILRSCRIAEETAFEVMDALGMVTFGNCEAV